MTAQFSDTFNYQGNDYDIAGLNGNELFDPAKFDFVPRSNSTACWKGFLATYAVQDGIFVLDQLNINLDNEPKKFLWFDRLPEINGKKPVNTPEDGPGTFFEYHFEDVGLKMDFTGGILIGRDFIQELYVHMGFHPAWKYREVHELLFEDGKLVKENNVSERMKEFRDKLKDAEDAGHEPERIEDIYSWVEKCFDLSYNF